MDKEQIEQHVPILGAVHLLGGALFVVLGIFVFVFLTGIGAAVAIEDPIAPRVLTFVGMSVGVLLVVLGLPGMAAGFGLLKRRAWARGLAIAIGVLNLVNFPLGTLIGVYTLIVLLQTDAEEVFVALKQA